jgi:hypothetical protein
MSALSAVSLGLVLRGLQLVLRLTNWDTKKRKKLFRYSIMAWVSWIMLTGLLARNGFFADFSAMPPRLLLVLAVPLLIFLIIAFSKTGTELIKRIPPHWLIGMQAFRILVELLLWRAFLLNLLPIQMTFEGDNFDGLSGVLAIPFAMMLYKKWSPGFALLYNIIGILLLLNILVIAILSMPTPFRFFMNEPPNTLVAVFPFVYLPAVLVALAMGLHIFSLRQCWLLRNKKTIV